MAVDSEQQSHTPAPTLLAAAENDNSQVPRDSIETYTDTAPSDDVETRRQSEKAAPDALDWDGPDDPDNPMNWPASKRYWQIFIVAMIQLVSYVSYPPLSS